MVVLEPIALAPSLDIEADQVQTAWPEAGREFLPGRIQPDFISFGSEARGFGGVGKQAARQEKAPVESFGNVQDQLPAEIPILSAGSAGTAVTEPVAHGLVKRDVSAKKETRGLKDQTAAIQARGRKAPALIREQGILALLVDSAVIPVRKAEKGFQRFVGSVRQRDPGGKKLRGNGYGVAAAPGMGA